MTLLIVLCFLTGCASTASVKIVEDGVEFRTDKPGKMSYEKDGVKVTYDTTSPSIMRTIIEGGAIKAATDKRID